MQTIEQKLSDLKDSDDSAIVSVTLGELRRFAGARRPRETPFLVIQNRPVFCGPYPEDR